MEKSSSWNVQPAEKNEGVREVNTNTAQSAAKER